MLTTPDYTLTPRAQHQQFTISQKDADAIDLADFGTLVIGLLDREIERSVKESQQATILGFLYRWYYIERLHHVLLPDALLQTVETVFKDEVLRDWILNLTAQVRIHVQSWPNYWEDLIDQLVDGLQPIAAVTGGDDVCLIPRPIQEQLRMDAEDVRSLLEQNAWLAVLIVIYLFFHQSSRFKPLGGEPSAELMAV